MYPILLASLISMDFFGKLLFLNTHYQEPGPAADVSRHILVLDTSVFAKSNMGWREYEIMSV
jgi:hypothetical protein